ncbi:hypothetical protein RE628_05035 [Paenibacillus sp. D2_2]|nr:hypothetical protein [Paenibacillus sp. D2_2]WMT41831.1 hypothetical protein RE628_05035 [Paenibacillus sp. D2_2]
MIGSLVAIVTRLPLPIIFVGGGLLPLSIGPKWLLVYRKAVS